MAPFHKKSTENSSQLRLYMSCDEILLIFDFNRTHLLLTLITFLLLSTAMGDVLFTTIEKWQGQKPWGRVLDAGTGAHSLKWLLALPTDGVVAITADDGMKRVIQSDPDICLKSTDRVVVGNWMNQEFCDALAADANKFDTIIADYLIGAVDGFSPYCQELVLGKLKDFLVPGGSLYIVGMEPIPDHALSPADVITEVV